MARDGVKTHYLRRCLCPFSVVVCVGRCLVHARPKHNQISLCLLLASTVAAKLAHAACSDFFFDFFYLKLCFEYRIHLFYVGFEFISYK